MVGVDLSREFLRLCDENHYATEDVTLVFGNVIDQNVDDYLARVRVDSEWRDRLLKLVRESWNPPRNPSKETYD
jgi:hypothetical protein